MLTLKNQTITLPSPSTLSYMWNMGSILLFLLATQTLSGLFISMHYAPSVVTSFPLIINMARSMNSGWIMKNFHANAASMFFLTMYIHTARNLLYSSYSLSLTWNIGVLIILALMMTAFLGYVLPWGQMSFWGATVITNLLSAIPYLGKTLVMWLWGGFSVNNDTLMRLYSLHFITPFIIIILVTLHLMALHFTGSSNPLGINFSLDKIPFHPFFTLKDILGIFIMAFILLTLITKTPFLLGDPENFIPANPMSTPVHIQPEWYLLFTYAILRSIPNKLGGVIALISSIMILMSLTLPKPMFNKAYPSHPQTSYVLMYLFLILTWAGMNPVEKPYIIIGQTSSLCYFTALLFIPVMKTSWNNLMFKLTH